MIAYNLVRTQKIRT